MPEDTEKNPLEQVVDEIADLFVYAPLGAAATLRDALPGLLERLAERGREDLTKRRAVAENQIAFARGVGQALIGYLRRRSRPPEPAVRAAAKVRPTAVEDLDGAAAIRRAQSQVGLSMQGRQGRPTEPDDDHRVGVAQARALAEGLAIPDYESLSAAQVNARLGALTPEELEAVRRYEEEHRGRRTVLVRIEALAAP